MARLFSLVLLVVWCLGEGYGGSGNEGVYQLTINMPEASVQTTKHNDYKCTAVELPKEDSYIVQFEPHANPKVAHHMLLFGCELPGGHSGSWSCVSMAGICSAGRPKILFAWALGAKGISLPEGVGLTIGPSQNTKFAVLQVHYGDPQAMAQTEGVNNAALSLYITKKWQPNVAGIYLLGSASQIKSGQEDAHVEVACKFAGPNTIYPFAFRTHAHSMGKVIAGYVVKEGTGGQKTWEIIGHRSPQDAQAFYPAENKVEVNSGDILAAQCVFDTQDHSSSVHMGSRSEDEMCNFYIMYYTANNGKPPTNTECWYAARHMKFPEIPPLPASTSSAAGHHEHTHVEEGEEEGEGEKDMIKQLEMVLNLLSTAEPSTPDIEDDRATEEKAKETSDEEEDDYICPTPVPPGPPSSCGPRASPTPIVAIETGDKGDDKDSFFEAEDKAHPDSTLNLVLSEDWLLNGIRNPVFEAKPWPIALGQASAVAVDKDGFVHVLHRGARVWDYDSFTANNQYRHTSDGPIATPTLLKFSAKGDLVAVWGAGVFYLPHGLAIDSSGNVWVTDVAMHQVFKFGYEGAPEPAMILGTEFEPGNAFGYFCKPSSVAVEDSGVFYVADGYCNHRILKFDPVGKLVGEWAEPVGGVLLSVPHSMALSPSQEKLYVADRENRRVVCYETATGVGEVFSDKKGLGRVFAVSFGRGGSWPLYAISVSSSLAQSGESESLGFSLNGDGEVTATWGPEGGFSSPHDLAVGKDTGVTYVVEIGPNAIWNFVVVGADLATDNPADLLSAETPTASPTNSTSAVSSTDGETSQTGTTSSESTSPPFNMTDSETSQPSTTSSESTTAASTVAASTDSETSPSGTTSSEGTTAAAETNATSSTTATTMTANTDSETSPSSTTGSEGATAASTMTANTDSETGSGGTTAASTMSANTDGETSQTSTTSSESTTVPTTTETNVNASEWQGNGSYSADNQTAAIESFDIINPHRHKKAATYGLIASMSFLAVLVVLVVGGIMRQQGVFHRSWDRLSGANKPNVKQSKGSGGKKGKSQAQQALHSLLGPGKFGFSRLRTYDSDSEMEEFPVFNRV